MAKNNKKTKKPCFYCVHNLAEVDYKDGEILRRFMSSFMKIAQRKRSGLCALHQRKASKAIKQARIAGILPFVPK
jgi:small subunit ribosomal protein S18